MQKLGHIQFPPVEMWELMCCLNSDSLPPQPRMWYLNLIKHSPSSLCLPPVPNSAKWPPSSPCSTEVLARIEAFVGGALEAVAAGQLPSLQLVSRSASNVRMVAAQVGPALQRGLW